MAESAGPPPVGGDQTRAPTIIGVYCALTTLSLGCVAARLYTRFRLLRSPGKDDVVIMISMVNIPPIYILSALRQILIGLGNCIFEPCFRMLRHEMGLRKTHILSFQRRGSASVQMELHRRSIWHHGSRPAQTGRRALFAEDCGKSKTLQNPDSFFRYLGDHRTLGCRCHHSFSAM